MPLRSRIFKYDKTEVNKGEQISLSWTAPYNAEILQFSANIGQLTPATTSDFVRITRETIEGPEWYNTILSWDPSVNGAIHLVCSGHGWQCRMGDIIRVSYANPDDLTCGVELIISEGN